MSLKCQYTAAHIMLLFHYFFAVFARNISADSQQVSRLRKFLIEQLCKS